MNKVILFTCIAVAFYALSNNILEQKLTKYSLGVIMTYFSLGSLICSLCLLAFQKHNGTLVVPPSKETLLIIFLAILFFSADYFYVGAYKLGGSVFTITTIFVLFPAFAATVKFLWVGGLPNAYQMFGYLAAIGSVFLFVKGS